MFECYTERARRVVFFARYEASQYGSNYIEAEHLLLGLVREDPHVIKRFVTGADVDIKKKVEERIVRHPKISTSIDLPLTHEGKRILAYANEEAERLTHRHIGTEHLLLGMLRESTCLAARLLDEIGMKLEDVRVLLSRSTRGAETSFEEFPPSPANVVNGRSSSTRMEDGTTVVETHQFLNGHQITIIERFRMNDSGKTLSYSQEIVGPKPEQQHKHAMEFDV
jgi:ATP-dependent Clp protease ATP-binding subunit ClpA